MNNELSNPYIEGMVSVIVPVYNSQKYLTLCLDSIVNQTYQNLELIIINDGSTDNSAEICKKYARQDIRVVVKNTENNGPARARNIGIHISKGSFIFFVDADDFIEKQTLSLLVEAYKKHNSELIIGGFSRVSGQGEGKREVYFEDIKENTVLTKQFLADYTLNYLKEPNKKPLFTYFWGRLFLASVIKENNIYLDESLRTFEDVAFNFKYLRYINNAYFLKDNLYNHLVHEDGSSASMAVHRSINNLFGYGKALSNAELFIESCTLDNNINIKNKIAHAFICYSIIQLVRLCGQLNYNNYFVIYNRVYELINDTVTIESIKHYTVIGNGSRVIPVLIKLKLVFIIMMVCRYKYYIRYNK